MHVEWICFSLKCKLWIVRFRTSRVSQQMCIKLIVGLIVLKLCVYLIDLRWLGQEWKPDCLYVISGSLYENMMKSRPSKTKFHCNYLMSSFRNWHGTGCVVWTVSKQWYCYNCSILPTYCRLCNGSYLPGRKPTTPLLCSAIIAAILYAQLNDALPKKKKKADNHWYLNRSNGFAHGEMQTLVQISKSMSVYNISPLLIFCFIKWHC